MLNKEEILAIINKNNLNDTDCIQILEQYIFDLKNTKVKINRPIGHPVILGFANIILDVELMMLMYNKAASYYFDKYKDG